MLFVRSIYVKLYAALNLLFYSCLYTYQLWGTVWRVFQLARGSSARFASFVRCSFFTFSLHAHTFGTAQGDE